MCLLLFVAARSSKLCPSQKDKNSFERLFLKKHPWKILAHWDNIVMLPFGMPWWACGCRSKCVPGTDNSLTLSAVLFRVPSFVLSTCSVLLLLDTFSKGAVIPMCSPRSEFALTRVAFRPEDAFIDLIANFIFRVIKVSIAVEIAFWTVSTILPTSLSNLLLKHISKVFTFTIFSLVARLLPGFSTVNSWSRLPLLTAAFSCLLLTLLPTKTSSSRSFNCLRSLLFDCFSCQWKPWLF